MILVQNMTASTKLGRAPVEAAGPKYSDWAVESGVSIAMQVMELCLQACLDEQTKNRPSMTCIQAC